jgi:hypothetical protein
VQINERIEIIAENLLKKMCKKPIRKVNWLCVNQGICV